MTPAVVYVDDSRVQYYQDTLVDNIGVVFGIQQIIVSGRLAV